MMITEASFVNEYTTNKYEVCLKPNQFKQRITSLNQAKTFECLSSFKRSSEFYIIITIIIIIRQRGRVVRALDL